MGKRILFIVLAFSIVGLLVVQFGISDSSLYSKKGKKGFLNTVAESLDFLNSPISGESGELNHASIVLEEDKGVFKTDNELKFKLIEKGEGEYPNLKVKFGKKKFLDRGREFEFYSIYKKPYLSPLYSDYLADQLSLISQNYKLWMLEMDGKEYPYFSKESYSKYLIEKQNVSNGVFFVMKVKEEEVKVKDVVGEHEEANGFISERASSLHEAMSVNDTLVLHELFDLNYLAKYFVFSQITGKFDEGKMRMVYRLTNGKFYPLAYGHSAYKNNKFNKEKYLDSKFWKWAFNSKNFVSRVNSSIDQMEDTWKEEINSITSTYAATLSSFSTNYSQRELNYKLQESANVALSNIDRLKENKVKVVEAEVGIVSNRKNFMMYHEHDMIESVLIEAGFEKEGNTFILKGEGHITSNTVVPALYKFVFEAGSNLRLDSAVNFLTYSPIFVKGTEEHPVGIIGVQGEEYGIFGVLGDDKNYSEVNYLDVFGGSEAKFNGIYMSGGFNIYHHNLILKNTKVHAHRADDGLNVKYGKIHIDNCDFYENYADQVDLDYCFGVVENSRFDNNAGDSNGDGLDFSGSEIIVQGCRFSDFDDKGISVGEYTKAIIRENEFSNNNLGMAIKDLSQIVLIDNVIKDNNVAYSLYQKKALFGGSTLYLFDNTLENNEKEFETDELSTIDRSNNQDYLNIITVRPFIP